MTRYLIRVEGELTSDLTSAFPTLEAEVQPVQTCLAGPIEDAAELAGILNHLNAIGVEIVELVRIPD